MTCYAPLLGYKSKIVNPSGKRSIVFNKDDGYTDLPVDRVIAVAGTHFIFDSFMECVTVRPMPVYSVPGMIDHF